MVKKATISNKNENSFVKKFLLQRLLFLNFLGDFTVKTQKHFYFICEKNKNSPKVFEIKIKMVTKKSI